jgi:hypothetical protein
MMINSSLIRIYHQLNPVIDNKKKLNILLIIRKMSKYLPAVFGVFGSLFATSVVFHTIFGYDHYNEELKQFEEEKEEMAKYYAKCNTPEEKREFLSFAQKMVSRPKY